MELQANEMRYKEWRDYGREGMPLLLAEAAGAGMLRSTPRESSPEVRTCVS
jgi:hypothetical protein